MRVFNNYGAVTSAVATLTVLHVNHQPVANSQSVGVLAGGSTPIVLTGTDVDNDPLTYAVMSSPAHGTLTGSPPSLIYQPDVNYSGSDSFTFTVNDGQTDSPPATVTINIVSAGTRPLLGVNLYAHLSPGLDVMKTGLAATGHNGNDYWNQYSRDAAPGEWLSFGALTDLKTVEGVATGAGLTIANAAGAWGNDSDDPMLRTYLYPLGGGNVTVALTNLASGQYDFYVYGGDSSYQVQVGGAQHEGRQQAAESCRLARGRAVCLIQERANRRPDAAPRSHGDGW